MATKDMSYDDSPLYAGRLLLGGTLSGANGVTPEVRGSRGDDRQGGQYLRPNRWHLCRPSLFLQGQRNHHQHDHAAFRGLRGNRRGANPDQQYLALGDLFYVAKGTDATLVEGCGIELQLIPGASVTA